MSGSEWLDGDQFATSVDRGDLRARCLERIGELRSTAEACGKAMAALPDVRLRDKVDHEYVSAVSPSVLLAMLNGWEEIVTAHVRDPEIVVGPACSCCIRPGMDGRRERWPCSLIRCCAQALGVSDV